MEWFSIAINIFTIILVFLVFSITFLAFNKRKDRNETWLQTFKRVWSSDKEVNETLSDTELVYGDIGTFDGQDWDKVPNILIKEADNQDDLTEFMDSYRPNMVALKPKTL
jgi:hypothetical protein